MQIVDDADTDLRAGLRKLEPVFEAARRTVHDAEAPLPERLQAIRLLARGLDQQGEDRESLARALGPKSPELLQSAAVAALGQLRIADAVSDLLVGWKSHTPALRGKVLDVVLQRANGPSMVLEALGREQILPQDVPLTARQRLLEHPVEDVRKQARQVFTDRVDSDRDKIVTAFADALELMGDASRGQQIFTKRCFVCHRQSGSKPALEERGATGQVVGPDLAMVRDKPPEWFLPALFDPSRAVEGRYVNYVAVTEDGMVLSGVLTEEMGDRLTLVSTTGQPQIVMRSNLERLTSTGKSAMPDGLEKELKKQDVADLIAFLRNLEAATDEEQ
jgi:putative heme-binding domain-containing protein